MYELKESTYRAELYDITERGEERILKSLVAIEKRWMFTSVFSQVSISNIVVPDSKKT